MKAMLQLLTDSPQPRSFPPLPAEEDPRRLSSQDRTAATPPGLPGPPCRAEGSGRTPPVPPGLGRPPPRSYLHRPSPGSKSPGPRMRAQGNGSNGRGRAGNGQWARGGGWCPPA